jgi:nucleoside-diphosphate-sugar epimerase
MDIANNKTYNITKSHSKTLLEAAELSVAIAGKGSINVRDRDLDFPSRGALNIDAARQDLGYNPKVDMEEGFEIYYRWLSESPYWQNQLKK